ncbi:MAG: hypothetical protein IJJ26_02955, partial [Victivallales bacterium]|nr:hypothetical protein [Victivallales bacterium]
MQNGYQHMLQDDFVERMADLHRRVAARVSTIHTQEDARAYQAEIQQVVDRAFAPFPREACPLEATTAWRRSYDGYEAEGIRFQIRESFWGTGILYLPANLDKPAP